ncbi:MAG: potassium/proton antiporter [Phycisphaerae bacterium]
MEPAVHHLSLFASPSISSEPLETAALLAVFGILSLIAVLSSRAADRIGVPAVLLLLGLGMLAGPQGFAGIHFQNFHFAFRLGTVALILILFEGGLTTPLGAVKTVLLPASLLATVGVAVTAIIIALAGHFLGLNWPEAMLIGAVVSSTDAAAVFSVLRAGRVRLKSRLARTLEVESCINDPMAVILTTMVIEILSHRQPALGWMLLQVPIQLIVGGVVGALLGFAARYILERVPLPSSSLLPAFTLAMAILSYGSATILQGSGFLAVYATALFMNAATLPFRSGLYRVHSALAWLGQIGMFLMLGLLILPSQLVHVAGMGLGIAFVLALVARPVAAAVCLLPLRYSIVETLYVGWTGLRGAVPIILATFPMMAHLPGAQNVFTIVFFVVVVNTLFPGTTIRWVTRRLGLGHDEKPSPEAVLEINSARPLGGELASFFIESSAAVCGAALRELDFPTGASVMLIVRNDQLIAPRGDTVIQCGDHVYMFFQPSDRSLMDLLFGRVEGGGLS